MLVYSQFGLWILFQLSRTSSWAIKTFSVIRQQIEQWQVSPSINGKYNIGTNSTRWDKSQMENLSVKEPENPINTDTVEMTNKMEIVSQ